METVIGFENFDNEEIFRPRVIESDNSLLRSEVGLFGTCGSPASTWRQDFFIPELQKRGLEFFNPQVEEWAPEMARIEADHLANDEVIVFPISKETHGYGSLAETGWAILSAMLRGQKLSVYIEEDEKMPADARRARALFKSLAQQMQKDYPVFQFEETIEDSVLWAVVVAKERRALKNSKIKETRKIELPSGIEFRNSVSILGTQVKNSGWKEKMKSDFTAAGVEYFDPYKDDWNEEDAAKEIDHKLKDKVILQVITGETESFGSLAESGLLALSAFVRGQAYGLYIEDHPSDRKSDSNRARALVRAHVNKLNEQFPGLVYLADSIDDLANFAENVIKK